MYKIEESWLSGTLDSQEVDRMVESYLNQYRTYISQMSIAAQRQECISGMNRIQRSQFWSSEFVDLDVKVGDICFIDYGHAYINEAGYQHFGLIVNVANYKIQVIPMTSKADHIKRARNVANYGVTQRRHLFYLGRPEGMNRPSVLFLNDMKYLNSARVISVTAHVCPDSDLFKDILKHMEEFSPL